MSNLLDNNKIKELESLIDILYSYNSSNSEDFQKHLNTLSLLNENRKESNNIYKELYDEIYDNYISKNLKYTIIGQVNKDEILFSNKIQKEKEKKQNIEVANAAKSNYYKDKYVNKDNIVLNNGVILEKNSESEYEYNSSENESDID